MNWTIITPSFGSLNGASQSALDLILSTKINIKNLSVIYKFRSKLPKKIDNHNFKNIKIYRAATFSPLPKLKKKKFSIQLRKWLDSKILDTYRNYKINKLNTNGLIVNSISGHNIYEKYLHLNFKKKILVIRESPRHFEYKFNEPNALQNAVTKMSHYDKYIFVSSNGLKEWKNILNLNENKCFYIPNCINENKFKTLLTFKKNTIRHQYGFDTNMFHIVCVASLQYRKGQDIIFSNLAEIKKIIPNFILHLVGSHFQPFTQELLSNENYTKFKSNIKIWGSRKDAYKLIYAGNLFLFPTRAEAFPRVILESMVLKTPILSSNVDGISEMIINNESGVLFSPDNHIELINGLNKIIKNKTILEKIINNASKTYWKKFSRNNQINNYKLFFQNLSK